MWVKQYSHEHKDYNTEPNGGQESSHAQREINTATRLRL